MLNFFLQIPTCTPAENECYQNLRHNSFDCKVACTGFFADINVRKGKSTMTNDLDGFNVGDNDERQKFERLLAQYGKYETAFLDNTHFEIENNENLFDGRSSVLRVHRNYSK